MKEEKYNSFDNERYHAMKYTENWMSVAEMSTFTDKLSRPCNTDPIEEEIEEDSDERLLLMM
jgi:hypothetical protein